MKNLILLAIIIGGIAKSFTTWPIFIGAIVLTAIITPAKTPKWWIGGEG